MRAWAAVLLLALPLWAAEPAPAVQLQALLTGRAVLQIGSDAPALFKVGETHNGLTLLAVTEHSATVRINGQTQKLSLNDSNHYQPPVVSSAVVHPYIAPPASPAESKQLQLVADGFGHFHAQASVGRHQFNCLVDTGATLLVLPEPLAKRLGFTPNDGRPVRSRTANGTALSYLITLPSLTLGPFHFSQINALIAPDFESDEALLGMNVLGQLKMQQSQNLMVLSRRP